MALDLELELGAVYGAWSSGWDAYDTVHDAESATYASEESPTASNTKGGTASHLIKRGLIDIDCSDIPLLMSISSAVLKMAAAWTLEYNRVVYAHLVNATGVTADNDGFGLMLAKTASLGSVLVPVTGVFGTQTGDKEITLNAAGRAFLEASAGGTARFGLRLSTDIDDEEPSTVEIQSFLTNPSVIEASARFEFPSDTVARVSSIRRIYRPGLYRMEIGVGELGFDVEVSEAAIKRVPDEVTEPEVPEEPEEPGKPAVVYQPGGFTDEQMKDIIALQQAIYPTEIPPWATRTTMPELYPPILYAAGSTAAEPKTSGLAASIARKIAAQDTAKWAGKPIAPEDKLTPEERAYLLSHYKAPPK